jgi:hypothetical protein
MRKGKAMRLELAMFAYLVVVGTTVGAQSDVTGEWRIDPPPADGQQVIFDLALEGARVIGTVRYRVLDVPVGAVPISEGRIEADSLTFKARSPDGDRTVTFTGTLQGDQITLRRDVEVRPGGRRGGLGIFGVGGPPRFVLKRVK